LLRGTLAVSRQLVEKGSEGVFERGIGDDFLEEGDGGRDVPEIPFVALMMANVGESSEGLHEALGGAVLEDGLDGFFFGDVFPEVEEFASILGGVVHVGVVEKGGEVVFLTSHAEALKVDDPSLAIVKHEVLRLKIAVDHVRSSGTEAFGEPAEDGIFAEFGGVFAKVGFDEMLEKIFLLPTIEMLIESGLEFKILGRTGVEKSVELFEGRAVVGLAFFEGGILEGKQVVVAEVFDKGDVAANVVVENAGDIEPGTAQEFCNGEEIGIIRTFEGVMHADEAGVVIGSDADDGASGGSLLNRLHENPVGWGEIEVGSDSGEESIGGHGSNPGEGLKIGVVMDA
jgi:hypothetical protein